MAPKKKARRVESVPDVTVSEQDAPGFPAEHMAPEPLASTQAGRRRPREVPAEEEAIAEERNQRKRRGRVGDAPAERKGGAADSTVTAALNRTQEQADVLDDGVENGRSKGEMLMECVVKVFCVHSEPNFSLPWQRKRQYSSTSSGFITADKRILTNAHSVDHHTQVKVRRRGSDAKYVAQVLAVGTECDIAMLTVEDPAFWEGVEPVKFGVLPRLQDSVTVIGFPIGGDTMSVTSGVVSRIEVTSYVHGAAELLGIQIDAAINSGNSGGPAFNNQGECVGIAFQSLKHEDAENIGYVIPTPVIDHFINDYARNGQYTAFPALGVEWQKMESPFMRKALGMKHNELTIIGVASCDAYQRMNTALPADQRTGGVDLTCVLGTRLFLSPVLSGLRFSYGIAAVKQADNLLLRIQAGQKGVLIRRIEPTAPANKVLKKGDILLSFDGIAIANDGTVPFRSGERISFNYLVSKKYTSEQAELSVLVDGKVKKMTVNLAQPVRLIPVHIKGRPPSYFIIAGLVFSQVSVPYLRSEYGKDYDFDAPVKLLDSMMHAMADEPDQQVVVLSQVLAADVNIGYEEMVNTRVQKVNGKQIKNLKELVRLIGGCTEEFLRLDLEYNQTVILETKVARTATKDIMTMHCIPTDRSADLITDTDTNGVSDNDAKTASV